MMCAKLCVTSRCLPLLMSVLAGCAAPSTRQEPAAPDASTSPLWLTIEEVEFVRGTRIRLSVSVDGASTIVYPARQVWSDGRSTERFSLPPGRSTHTLRFEATLADGSRTFEARASGPFTVDRSTLPLTRQYVRLYAADSSAWGRDAVARVKFSMEQDQQAQAASPAPSLTVEDAIARLEAAWDGANLGVEKRQDWPNQKADVEGLDAELAARLRADPQGKQTLLLWARRNAVSHRSDSLSAAEAALERVLAVEPRNAEALYYKGRIQARLVRAGNLRKRADLNGAVSLLRQAVESAPMNVRYRSTLVLFLHEQGLAGEANSMLGAIRKNDPVSRLLEELAAVPIPEGSEYLVDHPLEGAALMELLASETVEDYLRLRLRFYRIPKSRTEVEAFYAARMPGFRFMRAGESGTESDYLQFVRLVSGAARPSRDLREIPDPKQRQAGILMVLYEMRDDPDLGRKLAPHEHNCYLLLINTRK